MLGRRRQSLGGIWTFALGAAAGATAAVLLDPARGAARRARTRDQARAAARRVREEAARRARDASQRLEGRRYEAEHAHETVPDDVLVERVRAQLGKRASHAGAIEVRAENGIVILSGTIPRHELEPLLRLIPEIRGVRAVESRLEAHDGRGSAPAHPH
jgi:osmotically-inducible protein OsmY